MDLSSRLGDIFLGIASVAVSTAASLALGRWFNRRESRLKELREERTTDVEEFSEHRQAFQLRVKQLEDRCSELEEDVGNSREEINQLRRDNMTLWRTNFDLQRQLDVCREARNSGPYPHKEAG